MTTVSDLVDITREHLYGTQSGQFNFLTSTVDIDDTAVTFDMTAGGIVAGAVIGVDDEIMYVKSVSGQTATVHRDWAGTAAAHTAGAIIEVSPRFPRHAIKQALKEEIASWPDTLFQTPTPITLTGSTTTRAYNLTALGSFYDILNVVREPYSGSTAWVPVDFRVDRNMPTASFASGKALFLTHELAEGVDIRVTYSAPFTVSTFASATDVETAVGLSSSMLDIPPYGAAWRLLAPREIKRTFTESQPEPRLSEEVPAGAALRTAAGMKALRDQRIVEEGNRLAATRTIRF